MSLPLDVSGFVSVVACILSDLPQSPEVDGERMEITMDDAVTSFIKRTQGSSMIVTGWVVVASTAEGAIKGEPLGFTMLGSAGLAEHVKLGLLMSAANLIESEQLRERLGLPKPPEPPPF